MQSTPEIIKKSWDRVGYKPYNPHGTRVSCVEVDDPIFSSNNWINSTNPLIIFDSTIVFDTLCSNNCSEFTQINENLISIKTYPNPTRNSLTIELYNLDRYPYELAIYDNLGRKVYKSNFINEKNIEINVRDYKNGIYHYTLFCPSLNLRSTGKFIKN